MQDIIGDCAYNWSDFVINSLQMSSFYFNTEVFSWLLMAKDNIEGVALQC